MPCLHFAPSRRLTVPGVVRERKRSLVNAIMASASRCVMLLHLVQLVQLLQRLLLPAPLLQLPSYPSGLPSPRTTGCHVPVKGTGLLLTATSLLFLSFNLDSSLASLLHSLLPAHAQCGMRSLHQQP